MFKCDICSKIGLYGMRDLPTSRVLGPVVQCLQWPAAPAVPLPDSAAELVRGAALANDETKPGPAGWKVRHATLYHSHTGPSDIEP